MMGIQSLFLIVLLWTVYARGAMLMRIVNSVLGRGRVIVGVGRALGPSLAMARG